MGMIDVLPWTNTITDCVKTKCHNEISKIYIHLAYNSHFMHKHSMYRQHVYIIVESFS